MTDRVGKVAVRLLCAALIVAGSGANAGAACGLSGRIKHVIYVQFDNTHFRRDRPNIPSDPRADAEPAEFYRQQGQS
ncbi:MAG: hypothetical protein ACLQU2_06170 [Candidatus Binataceae bacterium]